MPIPQTRKDKQLGNCTNIPAAVRNKYRSDATLAHVLDAERVVSLSQLRKKYANSK